MLKVRASLRGSLIMSKESEHKAMVEGGPELYAVLRSGIRDLQDDRNFQSQRFQNLAIALGAGYGFISVGVDASERPLFVAVGLVSVNVGVLGLALLWRIQMKILEGSIRARYSALHEAAKKLRLPINPFALDLTVRTELSASEPHWGPRTTSQLQKLVPSVYAFYLSVMSGVTVVQLWALDFSPALP